MQETIQQADPHSLRHLTAAEFMALGGNAVVFVRSISGHDLNLLLPQTAGIDVEAEFHLVVSADGSPLMVSDTEEAVADWLSGKPFGVVTLH
jgi:hypothetical protein